MLSIYSKLCFSCKCFPDNSLGWSSCEYQKPRMCLSHYYVYNRPWGLHRGTCTPGGLFTTRANAVVFDHLSSITLIWVKYQNPKQIIQVHFEGWLWPTYWCHRYQHCSLFWGQGHCQVYNCKWSSIRPVAWVLDHLVYWRHYVLFWKITLIFCKTFFPPLPCLNSLPYLTCSFV